MSYTNYLQNRTIFTVRRRSRERAAAASLRITLPMRLHLSQSCYIQSDSLHSIWPWKVEREHPRATLVPQALHKVVRVAPCWKQVSKNQLCRKSREIHRNLTLRPPQARLVAFLRHLWMQVQRDQMESSQIEVSFYYRVFLPPFHARQQR